MFSNISNVEFYQNESLRKYCTFRIGGDARYVAIVHNQSEMLSVLNSCIQHDIRHKIIGRGANLLFDDDTYDGVIIVNRCDNLSFDGNRVTVDGGYNVSALNNACLNEKLQGTEFCFGVPSTVAGAIHNNLGCFGQEFGDLVESVKIFDKYNIFDINATKCDFQYRHSAFMQNDWCILSAVLYLQKGEKSQIRAKMTQNITKKSKSQPLDMPSAGSVFKRDKDHLPAKMIDDLGLKGYRIGDAMISTKHAGFIVNVGEASSRDVRQLIDYIQEQIWVNYHILLTPEIEYVK